MLTLKIKFSVQNNHFHLCDFENDFKQVCKYYLGLKNHIFTLELLLGGYGVILVVCKDMVFLIFKLKYCKKFSK